MTPARIRRFTPTSAALAATRLANRCLIAVLEGPAGGVLGRRLAVVRYTGRRTGRNHELVVAYTVDGPAVRIAVGMAEHKTWWRNFKDPRGLRLRLHGVEHDAIAHVVNDRDQVMVIAELTQTPERPLTTAPIHRGLPRRGTGRLVPTVRLPGGHAQCRNQELAHAAKCGARTPLRWRAVTKCSRAGLRWM
ncbi:nitroreductase/quinone reductase family protein [Ornithinimicrobium sp. LYQ92]|uniref:nitroreductase/quinone reductase family protein n=1 Tax=Serinicoccus sp. LYQ92 TaxID=3378798 RepID=UPI00385324A4